MKKIHLTLIAICAIMQCTYAQWTLTSGSTGSYYLNSGNVAIGTTTPVDILTIQTPNSSTGTYGGNYLRLKSWTGTTGGIFDNIFGGGSVQSVIAGNVGALTFSADPSINVSATSNGNEIMRIMGNGNVGIGNTSPQKTLDITGQQIIHNNLQSAYAMEVNLGSSAAQGIQITGTTSSDGAGFVDNRAIGVAFEGSKSSTEDVMDLTNTGTGRALLASANTGPAGEFDTNYGAAVGLKITNSSNQGLGSVEDMVELSQTNQTANGGGVGLYTSLASSTNVTQKVSRMSTIWVNNTNGSGQAAMKFDVMNGGNLSEVMRLNGNNVGIGTTNPNARLDVTGTAMSGGASANLDPAQINLSFLSNSGKMLIGWNRTAGVGETDFIANSGLGTAGGFAFYNHPNTGPEIQLMYIMGNGNVLIGQDTQVNSTYKLDVAGNVRVNEIVVNTTGADFVFEPKYHLIPLANLEKYLDRNHHLPEIASAKEMQTNGLNVGENQTKLLQKVEELTLYLIEQKNANEAMLKEIHKMRSELNSLKKKVK